MYETKIEKDRREQILFSQIMTGEKKVTINVNGIHFDMVLLESGGWQIDFCGKPVYKSKLKKKFSGYARLFDALGKSDFLRKQKYTYTLV